MGAGFIFAVSFGGRSLCLYSELFYIISKSDEICLYFARIATAYFQSLSSYHFTTDSGARNSPIVLQ
jgi:hypothetical protein